MTELPKASGMVEDHPPCRKTLSRGRFLWISAAGKNTQNTSLAEAEKQVEASHREKKKSLSKEAGVMQNIKSLYI